MNFTYPGIKATKTHSPSRRVDAQFPPVPIGGRVNEVLLAFRIMTIPMVLFSALLLGLIYHFRVEPTTSSTSNLSLSSPTQAPRFILVTISATTLTTIASWSSTVAPLLIVWALILASYPIARQILLESRCGTVNGLPTPYQFAIMTRMIRNASPSSLWQWLTYYVGWRGRDTQSKPLRAMTSVLALSSLLSIRLVERCLNVSGPFMNLCTVNRAATATFLYDSNETLPLLVNSPKTSMVKAHTAGRDEYAYLGMPPLPALENIDFTARTYAVKSACSPVTKECFAEDRISGPVAFYKCPLTMEGSIDTGPTDTIKWAYFTDSTGENNNTAGGSIQNPYHYAAIISVNQNIGKKAYVIKDPQMKSGLHGSTLFAAFCEATVYDLEYSFVNGSITRFITSLSNNSMANILQGTQQYTQVGSPYVLQAGAVAAYNSNSSTELAEKFALAYSQAALAVSVGAVFPAAPLEAQQRRSLLVARVPKTPLFFLVASNLLLVLLGLVLTLLALIALRGGEAGEVQARLSIAAIVAAHFERSRGEQPVNKIEKLFEENRGVQGPRIGVERSQSGGWRFVSK
ncbi:uncharacterized protein BDR25DRAFT_310334 [Lindgomyces ingoldianus]|uniref:Uncharacterized protein n=1 Tax=Lindgomyces ingoldianus TaxID=673940 RepID=A0ACB6RAU6_9PLEO|nr:uncharacterized protein BDR25DRAFT_310334 [Lindgomyces ingoldianus]KAF2475883.1 hypothetical protein BDR25DRAFT_310334 [Lindgomyces ingoldianus]